MRYVARSGTITIGLNETMKKVKLGQLKFIVIASNAPENVRKDVVYYAKLSNIPIIEFPGSNKDLGTLIGKPFSVALIGIIDPGQVSAEMLIKYAKT